MSEDEHCLGNRSAGPSAGIEGGRGEREGPLAHVHEVEGKRRRVIPGTLVGASPALTSSSSSSTSTSGSSLPSLELPEELRWHIAENPQECVDVAKRMSNLCRGAGITIWGFDIEWFVSYEVGLQRPVALIQFHRGCDVVLFHVSRCGLCPELVEVLTSPSVIKVGVSISGDKCKLERDFQELRSSEMRGYVDLKTFQERGFFAAGAVPTGFPSGRGLSDMVKDILQRTLKKPETLRRGNWELEFSREMKRYAALDAYAGSVLFDRLLDIMRTGSSFKDLDIHKLLADISLLPALAAIALPHHPDATVAASASASASTDTVTFTTSDGQSLSLTAEVVISQVTESNPTLKEAWAASGSADCVELPSRASTFLDKFDSCLVRNVLFPQQRLAYAKTEALAQFMRAAGLHDVDQLAAARGIKPSTFASYLVECMQSGQPVVFGYFRIEKLIRNLIAVRSVQYFADAAGRAALLGPDINIASATPFKTRRHLFDILKLVQQQQQQPPIEFWQVQVVDTHFTSLFGRSDWEVLFHA